MMKKNKIILLIISVILLSACSGTSPKRERPYYTKDTNAFNILIDQVANNIQDIWGSKEVLIAGPKDYVHYSENLQTRVHINFISGKITIETLSEDPIPELKNAIVATLLMTEPVDILTESAKEADQNKEPFLYKQVLDEAGQPIRWAWRANSFAKYLLDNQMKIRFAGEKQVTYVAINLVANHVNQRAHKFLPLVQEPSARYNLDQALILAIMQVESNYNPFAISRSDAIGLMQVQQHTAGRDLFQNWGKRGEPSRSYLLDPQNNINMGSAYLALIRDRYLAGITHPLSMQYAMITAYNGGAGSVLMTFSKDRRKAVDVINSLTPEEVYHILTSKHASQESRNYLVKVNAILRNK